MSVRSVLPILDRIKRELAPYQASLVAVSKTKPVHEIMNLYEHGQRIFGENRAQELAEKATLLPADIEWHMIGHLQSKKVKIIASVVHTIHSVDSIKLLLEIEKQAKKHQRNIRVLIQLKIAQEESKYGLQSVEEIRVFFGQVQEINFENIEIAGVMGMASFTDDVDQIRREFNLLKKYFDQIKSEFYTDDQRFTERSMGMSGDYGLALEAGSTMVRIGSLLFGPRNQ